MSEVPKSEKPMNGRCLCGAVSFTATGVETHHHACHCRMCQRWVGGPLLAATVKDIVFEGREHIKTFASSDWAERAFCNQCGSALYYLFKAADMKIVSVGLFDDTESFQLHGEIFVDNKMPGIAFAGDHERLTEAQTLARFQAGN